MDTNNIIFSFFHSSNYDTIKNHYSKLSQKPYIQNYKKGLFTESQHYTLFSFFKKDIEQYETLRKKLIVYNWDKHNMKNYSIAYKKPNVMVLPDKHKYHLLNKKVKYLDLSLQSILKRLYASGKISKNQYRKAIKSHYDKLPKDITEKVSLFYKSIKGQLGRNSINSLNKQSSKKRYLVQSHKHNNHNYKILLKKYIPYKWNTDILLNTEFSIKLDSDNNIIA